MDPVTTPATFGEQLSALAGKFTSPDIIAAVFAVGAVVIVIDMAFIGYRKVRRMIKGA